MAYLGRMCLGEHTDTQASHHGLQPPQVHLRADHVAQLLPRAQLREGGLLQDLRQQLEAAARGRVQQTGLCPGRRVQSQEAVLRWAAGLVVRRTA